MSAAATYQSLSLILQFVYTAPLCREHTEVPNLLLRFNLRREENLSIIVLPHFRVPIEFICSRCRYNNILERFLIHALLSISRCTVYVYRIALVFRGSKFSRIAALKEFIENISRICVARVCYSTVAKILVQ